MGFSKAGIAVDEKRVIVSYIVGRNRHCCRMGKFVGVSDDEVVKGIFNVDNALVFLLGSTYTTSPG